MTGTDGLSYFVLAGEYAYSRVVIETGFELTAGDGFTGREPIRAVKKKYRAYKQVRRKNIEITIDGALDIGPLLIISFLCAKPPTR